MAFCIWVQCSYILFGCLLWSVKVYHWIWADILLLQPNELRRRSKLSPWAWKEWNIRQCHRSWVEFFCILYIFPVLRLLQLELVVFTRSSTLIHIPRTSIYKWLLHTQDRKAHSIRRGIMCQHSDHNLWIIPTYNSSILNYCILILKEYCICRHGGPNHITWPSCSGCLLYLYIHCGIPGNVHGISRCSPVQTLTSFQQDEHILCSQSMFYYLWKKPSGISGEKYKRIWRSSAWSPPHVAETSSLWLRYVGNK